MNPEFKRNLWQVFTAQRLIAMPAFLLAIFFIVYLQNDQIGLSVPHAALNIIFLLLVVWGSGLSADAIFQELREHTWDSQRMTPLGPWSMTWGKIFGSTIFVWYGAFWCLVAIGITGLFANEGIQYSNLSYDIVYYLLIGIFAQTFGLFTSLLFQRISPLNSRARVVLIQLFTIAVAYAVFLMGRQALAELFKIHTWYGLNLDYQTFAIGSLILFCLCLFFGIYRLLRNELQMRSLPWAWPLFVLIWIFYVGGFVYFVTGQEIPQSNLTVTWFGTSYPAKLNIPQSYLTMVWLGTAYFIALQGSIYAAFFTPKNIVHYFRLVKYIKECRIIPAFSLTPPWIFSTILSLILLLILLFKWQHFDFPDPKVIFIFMGFFISLFFFLLRDIGILYYITFNFHAKRAHLAAIVYLIALYTLIPILLSYTDLPDYWYPALAPWAWFKESVPVTTGQIAFISSLILIQDLIAWGLVFTRWRMEAKQLA